MKFSSGKGRLLIFDLESADWESFYIYYSKMHEFRMKCPFHFFFVMLKPPRSLIFILLQKAGALVKPSQFSTVAP